MKIWKWIVSVLVLLGINLIAVNFSKKPLVHTNKTRNSVQESKITKAVLPIIYNSSDSEQIPSTISDLSIVELSELSKEHIVQCKDPYVVFDNNFKSSSAEFQDIIFQTWSKSNEFEQQLAMALIHTNIRAITFNGQVAEHKRNYTNLSQLVESFPNSKIAHYFLISHCTRQNNCKNSVFDSALVLDPYNGALWKLKAIREAAAGEVELALTAIENSIAAANYESYWGESIHMFEQALASTLELDVLARRVTAIGYSAALVLPDFGILLNLCGEQSALRADIADACLRMGARQFLSGDTLLEQHIGLATQKIVYEQQKKILEVQRIETKHQEFREATTRLSTATNLALHDKNLNNYWWENILLYGETKALKLTFSEAVRLSSAPDYNPCPNGKIEPAEKNQGISTIYH